MLEELLQIICAGRKDVLDGKETSELIPGQKYF